jgi:hypothetical protein
MFANFRRKLSKKGFLSSNSKSPPLNNNSEEKPSEQSYNKLLKLRVSREEEINCPGPETNEISDVGTSQQNFYSTEVNLMNSRVDSIEEIEASDEALDIESQIRESVEVNINQSRATDLNVYDHSFSDTSLDENDETGDVPLNFSSTEVSVTSRTVEINLGNFNSYETSLIESRAALENENFERSSQSKLSNSCPIKVSPSRSRIIESDLMNSNAIRNSTGILGLDGMVYFFVLFIA